jgi:hypothetical protein
MILLSVGIIQSQNIAVVVLNGRVGMHTDIFAAQVRRYKRALSECFQHIRHNSISLLVTDHFSKLG